MAKMSKLTSKQTKAYAWFVKTYSLKPLLSNPPIMYFKDEYGEELKYNMDYILARFAEYEKDVV